MKVPVIEVSGNPYELGYQHGKQAREAVQKNIQFYLDLWKHFGEKKPEVILQHLHKFLPYVEKADSELIEEMKGLAEGAEVKFDHILALNCRYELTFGFMKGFLMEGCTSFGLRPEVTLDRHIYVGQNWDYKPSVEHSCIILRLKQKKKPEILMYTEAGVIGSRGFNSDGIGICLNFMWCAEDIFKPGLPAWLKVRAVLNCHNLIEGLRVLTNFEGPNSISMMIAHRDGEVLNVECAPGDTFFLFPEGGVLTHSNHYLSPRLSVKDTGINSVPDTVIRSQRSYRLFQGKKGSLDVGSITSVMSDHFGYPHSICRHRAAEVHPYEQFESLSSIIMDLTAGKMHYSYGPPCSNKHELVAMG
jgi:isopenicillin-N N-acyltransferase-like protein